MNPDPNPNPNPNRDNPNNLLDTIILLGYNVRIGCANDVFGKQTLSGIQLPPQVLTFGCFTHKASKKVFCPLKF